MIRSYFSLSKICLITLLARSTTGPAPRSCAGSGLPGTRGACAGSRGSARPARAGGGCAPIRPAWARRCRASRRRLELVGHVGEFLLSRLPNSASSLACAALAGVVSRSTRSVLTKPIFSSWALRIGRPAQQRPQADDFRRYSSERGPDLELQSSRFYRWLLRKRVPQLSLSGPPGDPAQAQARRGRAGCRPSSSRIRPTLPTSEAEDTRSVRSLPAPGTGNVELAVDVDPAVAAVVSAGDVAPARASPGRTRAPCPGRRRRSS